MRSTLDAVLTTTLVGCALATTGVVIYREFIAPPTSHGEQAEQRAVFVDSWRSLLAQGAQVGPTEAPVHIIEFSDYECPFCANFHKTLKVLRDRYPKEVAITYIHFPLPTHRFAEPAVRVAECAGEQGRFEAVHDRLFNQQNQLGIKPWREFAIESGVPDSAAFDLCIRSVVPLQRVTQGRQSADQLGIRGTPTVIMNGWKLSHPPDVEELDAMVKEILAGRSPVPHVEN